MTVRLRRAFTLIELVVAIAIIAIVASIVVAVVARVRVYSQRGTCIANLRQIGMALDMYLQDYGDYPAHLWQLKERGSFDSRLLFCPTDPIDQTGLAGLWWKRILPGALCRGSDLYPVPVSYHYAGDLLRGCDVAPHIWAKLTTEVPQAGIVACQLHGDTTGEPKDMLMGYEGVVLRLQFDGAVVTRKIRWPRDPRDPDGIKCADPWAFFSDTRPAPQPSGCL